MTILRIVAGSFQIWGGRVFCVPEGAKDGIAILMALVAGYYGIDLSFYQDMIIKLGASDNFAQTYVMTYKVGYHVKNLLGIEPMVCQM